MAPIGFSLLLLLRIYRRREMPSYGEINPIPFHTCLLVVLWISGWIITRCPPSNECRPSIIRWIRPSSGRLKLNVDGAWNSVEAKGVLYSGTRGEGSWVLLLAPSRTSSPRHKSRSSLFELGLSW